MKPSNIIKTAATAILLLAILTTAGFAFVPSIFTSIDNKKARECRENSEKLLELLESEMTSDTENKFWYDLVAEKNSSKLINAVNHEMDPPVDVSGYYIKFAGNRLRLLCSKHPQELEMTMKIPDNLVHIERTYDKPKSGLVTSIHAEGLGVYFTGVPLDKSNPEKMIFTDEDDTSALFPDIAVIASYAGGGERRLEPDEYKILTGKLDMSQPGRRTFLIEYRVKGLALARTVFDIDVLPNVRTAPLVIKSKAGSYELAAWDWMDYFSDALDEPGEYMEFSPSVVRDNGKYYYFPDGFSIIKDSKYNGTVKGALEKNGHDSPARYIILDTESEAYTDNAPKKPREGSIRVKAACDEIFVWQKKPSREFGKGWIQIFDDIKKLDE